MNEPKKDLKLGGGEDSSGSGQPDKKNTSSDSNLDESPSGGPTGDEGGEKVTISKTELEQLKRDKENYKKGLMSHKEKLKALQGNDDQTSQEDSQKSESSEFLSKKEFYETNEKKAIKEFVKENPEVKNNWDEFVKHYPNKRGKQTVEDILADLDDAKTLYDKYSSKDKSSSDKSEASAELSKEKASPSGGNNPDGGGRSTKKGGRKIIPNKTRPQDWYPE